MPLVRLRVLVATAVALTALATFPALASGQACGADDPALSDARAAANAAFDAVVAAIKEGNPAKQAAADKAAKDAYKKMRDLEDGPCLDLSGGLVHNSSLNGVTGDVEIDKDFQTFYSKAPAPLKARSFVRGWDQTAGASRPQQKPTEFKLGLVGEVAFDHGGGATLLGFLGGVRFTALGMSPKLAPFGQFLVGVEHCGLCQYNAFSLQPGFGVKYALRPRLGLLAQLDFRLVPSSENELRLSAGVSIPFGK